MSVFTLTQIITEMKACSVAAGFCQFKFGKPAHINFDHNICYDLINIDYPTSLIVPGNREVHTFSATLARRAKIGTPNGVTVLDAVHTQMTALEKKLWNFLSCVSVGGGNDPCADTIPKSQIKIVRDKGLFNDNLITLQVRFDMVTALGGGSTDACSECGFYDPEYVDPCDPCGDATTTFPADETAAPSY